VSSQGQGLGDGEDQSDQHEREVQSKANPTLALAQADSPQTVVGADAEGCCHHDGQWYDLPQRPGHRESTAIPAAPSRESNPRIAQARLPRTGCSRLAVCRRGRRQRIQGRLRFRASPGCSVQSAGHRARRPRCVAPLDDVWRDQGPDRPAAPYLSRRRSARHGDLRAGTGARSKVA
jgi:hypothetical protein